MADSPSPDLSPVYDALRQADAAGDSAGAAKLAAYIQSQGAHRYGTGRAMQEGPDGTQVPVGSAAAQEANSPTSGMSGFDKFRAGYGKAAVDLARGAGQMVGLESRQDVADSRQRDAALMATGAGKAGDITGSIFDYAPLAAIPGANTLAGAAAIGAGTGLLQPSASTKETALNTGLGGLLGPATIAGGRVLGAVGKGAYSALEPATAAGQERVAARALQSFAKDPNAATNIDSALQGSVLPGVQPTTAEVANNPGLAQLQRTLKNNPDYLTALTQRDQANRGVMTSALDSLAGTDAQRAAAVQARSSTAAPLYQQAKNTTVPADDTLRMILQRPSLQDAWSRASRLAEERGEPLVTGRDLPERTVNSPVLDSSGAPFSTTLPAQNSQYSGRAIQYLKMAMNDMLSGGKQSGMGSHEEGALRSTLGDLNTWTQQNVPSLRAADATYAAQSGPINQMDVGRALRDKLVPALGDFGNNTRLSSANYANALRNGDDIASNVTGNPSAKLSDVLTRAQQGTVRQIAEQLARRSNADELGRAVGSNTGQNLVSQNTLRQALGPLGLPQGWADAAAQSALGQTLMRPVQFAGKVVEPRIQDVMARAALDPAYASRLLKQQTQSKLGRALWNRQGLLGPSGALSAPAMGGLLGGNSAQ